MFRILEQHTADIGIEVEAPTLEALFVDAARGWKYLVLEDAPTTPAETRAISLHATDLNDLLVQWISELNFLLNAHYWVFHSVQQLKITRGQNGYQLQAEITGEPLDPERHYIYFEIKAVTYHQLHIQKIDGKYKTRIIFDI